MIKAIGLRRINISQEEWDYYQEIVKKYTDEKQNGSVYFENLFETNKEGIITIIKPINNIPMEVLHFVLNLQINQHLRLFDNRITDIEKKIGIET